MSTIPCHVKHLSHADQFLYIDQRKIEAAHPTRRDERETRPAAYSAWNVALVLVGEREAKHDLVDLVGYLIDQNLQLSTTLLATRRAAHEGMDAAKRTSTIQLELAEKARAESSPEALASERAANALLTEENERLRAQLEAERQPWIPVTAGLPDIRSLAYTPSDNRLMEHRIIPGGMFRQIAKDATHWMPLPSNPPKAPT